MDKASDFESEDCGFESRRGHVWCLLEFAGHYNKINVEFAAGAPKS